MTTSTINNLENELYHDLVNNKKMMSEEWDFVSLVISKGGKSRFGYRFYGDDWEAFGPSGFEWMRIAEALYKAMDEEGRPWIKMLMCFNKESNSYAIEYEYKDKNRWSLGAKDIGSMEEFAFSLKRE